MSGIIGDVGSRSGIIGDSPAGHVLQVLHYEVTETNSITETYTNYWENALTLKSASSDVFIVCMFNCSINSSAGFGTKIYRNDSATVTTSHTAVWTKNTINSGSPLTDYNDTIWNMRISSVLAQDVITGQSAGDTLYYGLFFEKYNANNVVIGSNYTTDGWMSIQLTEVQK